MGCFPVYLEKHFLVFESMYHFYISFVHNINKQGRSRFCLDQAAVLNFTTQINAMLAKEAEDFQRYLRELSEDCVTNCQPGIVFGLFTISWINSIVSANLKSSVFNILSSMYF